MSEINFVKIAILGGGIAGLSAARELRSNGCDVKVFDKSRGVGGRMSTRYEGDWEFDHGAQYFTAQDKDFIREIEAAVQAGAAASWPAKGLYLSGGPAGGEVSEDKGRARYVGTPRMNSLPKFWAQGLDVDLGLRVTKVSKLKSWTLAFEDGSVETGFDGVISTLPPAQTEDILPKDFPKAKAVAQAQMQACFALMVGLEMPLNLNWDTLRVKDLPIDWIAVNSAKPGRSSKVAALVIQSEADWSDKHANSDGAWIEAVMLDCASALTGLPLHSAPHKALHRWLYASSKVSPEVACLNGDGFVAAGDWCFGGRVQGAWLSGRAAARSFL